MHPLLTGYGLALGGILLLWLGISLFVVLTRALYDAQLRIVNSVQERLESASSDAAALDAELDRLPRKAVERIAASTATTPELARACAVHAAARSLPALLFAAAHHGGEMSKWRRIAALRILARARSAVALPLLADAIADDDADVVSAAIATLAELPETRAGELLVDALRLGTAPRSRIATELDAFPLPVGGLLLELLGSADAEVRYWAVKLLARYPELPELPERLSALAGDEAPTVRAAVAETLGTLGSAAAVDVGTSLLEDAVPFVRVHAARSLGRQPRPEVAGRVAALLGDEEWWVRNSAKRALERLGPDATEHVLPYLRSPDRFARNGAAEVLQNTGAVDELVRRVIADPSDGDRRSTLQLVLTAGERRFSEAVADRAGGQRDELGAILAMGAAPA